jgi:hypothetical protein
MNKQLTIILLIISSACQDKIANKSIANKDVVSSVKNTRKPKETLTCDTLKMCNRSFVQILKGSCFNNSGSTSGENKVIEYYIGDIDNDAINDTAFVESEHDPKIHMVHARFSSTLPTISVDNSLGIVVAKTVDVNDDDVNEILIFSRTNEGCWNNLSVWTCKKNNWIQIAKTTAFIAEQTHFENRIVKENGVNFLIGEDKWKEDERGDFLKIKTKL